MTPSRLGGRTAPPGSPGPRGGLPGPSCATTTGPGTAVTNAVTDGVFQGPVVMAGTVTGGIHHHAAPPVQVTARQLPPCAPYFTNRVTETAALDAARATGTRTVVLSGIAGVGKSALAAQWLHTQQVTADAQLHAALTPPQGAGSHPEDVLAPWLRALGVERPPGRGAELVGLWRSLTAQREIHVLIDGARDAEQVRPLLPSGSRSVAVVTSRRLLWELSADGALLLPLGPLDQRDAVALLCAAAGAPDTATAEGPSRTAAEALAAACAHLPLPLVLTGARLRSRPGRPFTDTARPPGRSSHDPQERALMAIADALTTSYDALQPEAQYLYRALGSLPVTTADADLAAAVCAMSPAEAGWFLEVLADERLLDPAPPGEAPHPRYRMGNAVRDHAHSTALEAGTAQEREGALRRLGDWLLDYARHAQRVLTPAQATLLNPAPAGPAPDGLFEDAAAALAWLDGQERNFLPVLKATESAGWDERVYELVDAWWPFFTFRHRYRLWAEAHEIGAAAARRAGNEAVLRQMLTSGAIGLSADGELAEAADWYEQVRRSARAAGDVRDEGQALLGMGACRLEAGDPVQAREHVHAAMSRWEACGYARGVGLAEITLGEICLAEDDPTAARIHLTSAHRRLNELAEPYEAARALALHGHARVRCGESAEAIADLDRALAAVAPSTRWQARTLEWLGDAHHQRGDAGTARAYWRKAEDLNETMQRPADTVRLREKAAER
ncbi:tetratricopeptide repeat protein [Streptomyces sp. NBRC 110465]|uniref:tetratricopeptide repeat protein n=1 Tax=Streptomyces sp. NBRC 110465 TaxID=1897621 RepID=UPI0009A0B67B|nr:tetratricopeptide repeat protein [Streptomyces sp. NBRC 110465]